MKKKKVLIVNWGTPSSFFPLSRVNKLASFDCYLVTTRKVPNDIYNMFGKRRVIYSNPYDYVTLCEDVQEYCQRKKVTFDVVTTFFEMSVMQTAILADYLGVPRKLPAASAIKTSVNKLLMRQAVKVSGIPQPSFLSFYKDEVEKVVAFLKSCEQGIVIKPVHSGHSYGARYISHSASKNEISLSIAEASKDLDRSYDEWMDYYTPSKRRFLAEAYIPGPVCSFDGIVGDKNDILFLGNAEFLTAEMPLFQQMGHIVPMRALSDKEKKQSMEYVVSVVRALGLQYCGFHCEFKYYQGKPNLIEISGRLPGGPLLETYYNASDVDFFDTLLKKMMGSKEITKKNSIVKSEVLRLYYSTDIGVLANFQSEHIYNKSLTGRDIQLRVQSRSDGDVLLPTDEIGSWLMSHTVRSTSLAAGELFEASLPLYEDSVQLLRIRRGVSESALLVRHVAKEKLRAFASIFKNAG